MPTAESAGLRALRKAPGAAVPPAPKLQPPLDGQSPCPRAPGALVACRKQLVPHSGRDFGARLPCPLRGGVEKVQGLLLLLRRRERLPGIVTPSPEHAPHPRFLNSQESIVGDPSQCQAFGSQLEERRGDRLALLLEPSCVIHGIGELHTTRDLGKSAWLKAQRMVGASALEGAPCVLAPQCRRLTQRSGSSPL